MLRLSRARDLPASEQLRALPLPADEGDHLARLSASPTPRSRDPWTIEPTPDRRGCKRRCGQIDRMSPGRTGAALRDGDFTADARRRVGPPADAAATVARIGGHFAAGGDGSDAARRQSLHLAPGPAMGRRAVAAVPVARGIAGAAEGQGAGLIDLEPIPGPRRRRRPAVGRSSVRGGWGRRRRIGRGWGWRFWRRRRRRRRWRRRIGLGRRRRRLWGWRWWWGRRRRGRRRRRLRRGRRRLRSWRGSSVRRWRRNRRGIGGRGQRGCRIRIDRPRIGGHGRGGALGRCQAGVQRDHGRRPQLARQGSGVVHPHQRRRGPGGVAREQRPDRWRTRRHAPAPPHGAGACRPRRSPARAPAP